MRENVAEWFDHASDSPYMLSVGDVREDKRRAMTAAEQALFGIEKLNVARSENSGRDAHRLFRPDPDRARRHQSAVPTPEDAFRCFMGNELDLLVIGNCVLRKTEQNPAL